MRGIASAGLVIIVLVTVGLAVVAMTRPAGGPPLPPSPAGAVLQIDSLDDLASMSEQDLRRLLEAGGEIEVRDLGRDVEHDLAELSEGIRELDPTFVVPATANRSGTASTGGSGRRRTASSTPSGRRTSP